MRNKIFKTLITILIMILAIIALQTISNAATLNISTSKSTVSPGETFTVTVSLSGGAGPINATTSNGSGSKNDFLDNNSFSFSCTAGNSGSVTITASGTVGDYTTEADVYVSNSRTVTISTPVAPPPTSTPEPSTPTVSSNANLSNLGINPYDFRGFKATQTSYSVTVPKEVSSINIYAYAQDSKATVSGTGNKSLNIGNNTFKVTVKAQDGTTKTYTLYITRKAEDTVEQPKSSDSSLSALSVAEGAITPEFDASIKEYTLNVSEEILDVNITAIPNSNNATVKIEGGTALQLGENIATITITAEDGAVETYTLKIIKGNMKVALQELVIGYINEEGQFIELPLSPIFNEDVLEYALEDLDYSIDQLKIDALATNSGLIIEIKGNEDLKTGENIITIIVRKEPATELEEAQEVEYKIIVNKKAEPTQEAIGIIEKIKNWFTSLPGIVGNFVSTNKKIIIVSSLGLCALAMLWLSIYIVIDYRKYKMILAKLSALVKENSEISTPQLEQNNSQNEE